MYIIINGLKYIISTILEILHYSSWPLVIVFIVMYYKKTIKSILDRTVKLGWGGAEIEFDTALNKLDEVKDDKKKLKELIKKNNRMNVLDKFTETRLSIENKYIKIQQKLIEKYGRLSEKNNFNAPNQDIEFLDSINMLSFIGLFSDYDKGVLSAVIQLRNSVAHNPYNDLSDENTRRYIKECNYLINRLNSFKVDDKNIEHIHNIISKNDKMLLLWDVS